LLSQQIMRALTVLLLTLVLLRSSSADESLPPLRRPDLRARSVVGVSLVVALLGSGLAAADVGGSSGRWAGIGLISVAGFTTLTSTVSEALYGVGYRRGLHASRKVGLLESAEDLALDREKAPMMVTLAGVATLVTGIFLCVFNVADGGSRPTLDAGMAVSALGATVSSLGSVWWSYAAGMTRGTREARATFALSATGLRGTF
jgi:hypothetical protein